MARPRKFDEERAVASAMRVFWQRGYDATSTSDLCAATGLGRGSVYNTFSSKHELFERALEQYAAERNAEFAELLRARGSVREKVRALFDSILADDSLRDGCLVVNTLIELAPREPVIAARLREDYGRRLELLRTTLEAAQRTGELDPEVSAEELAHLVLGTVTAIRVMARGGSERSSLEAMASAALRAI